MKGPAANRAYFLIIAVLVVLLGPLAQAGQAQEITAESIIERTNGERAERNLAVLEGNSTLNRVAQIRLEDMLRHRYFGHNSPSGEKVTDLAGAFDYQYIRIGENLAKGTFRSTADLVAGWMKSPNHRKNLLSPDFHDIGVAVALERVNGRDYWHAVQVFGALHHCATGPQYR